MALEMLSTSRLDMNSFGTECVQLYHEVIGALSSFSSCILFACSLNIMYELQRLEQRLKHALVLKLRVGDDLSGADGQEHEREY